MSAYDWIGVGGLVLMLLAAVYWRGRMDGARAALRIVRTGGEPCWRCDGTGVER